MFFFKKYPRVTCPDRKDESFSFSPFSPKLHQQVHEHSNVLFSVSIDEIYRVCEKGYVDQLLGLLNNYDLSTTINDYFNNKGLKIVI